MNSEARLKVFLVDDSPIVRERLIGMLSDLPNVEISGQADVAFEAIRAIRKLKPHVAVLDISMPGGSGMHVLEMIKKENSPPLVIMLTNFSHEQYRKKCLQLGADYFFDKSNEFEKVFEVLGGLNPLNIGAPAVLSAPVGAVMPGAVQPTLDPSAAQGLGK